MTATSTDADLAVRPSFVRSAAVVGIALMAGNLASYLLAIIGSHRLRPSDYGLFGAMLAILLIGGIPSLALQAVVARRTAAENLVVRRALREGLLVGLISVAVGLVLWPGLTRFLHVGDHGLAILFTVASLLPLNLQAAAQGHLQGEEKFERLALLVVVIGVGRLLGGVIPLMLGAEATGAMAGMAIATALSAAVALRVVKRSAGPSLTPAGPIEDDVSARPELVTATLSMGALLLLSSLDLLLARHVLPATEAGRYAAGNVVAKAAFWLPQAVALTALPRLSRTEDRAKALRDAALLTAAIAAVSITVTAVAGDFLVRLTFGTGYESIGGIAWLFALQGSALAGVQLLVFHDIAARRRGVVPLVLIAAAIETVVILALAPHTPRPIITIAATVAVFLVLATAVQHQLVLRRQQAQAGARTAAGDQWAASSQLRPTPTETSSGTSRA
jgi:O-antigen/teichoic acid export membrane protein